MDHNKLLLGLLSYWRYRIPNMQESEKIHFEWILLRVLYFFGFTLLDVSRLLEKCEDPKAKLIFRILTNESSLTGFQRDKMLLHVLHTVNVTLLDIHPFILDVPWSSMDFEYDRDWVSESDGSMLTSVDPTYCPQTIFNQFEEFSNDSEYVTLHTKIKETADDETGWINATYPSKKGAKKIRFPVVTLKAASNLRVLALASLDKQSRVILMIEENHKRYEKYINETLIQIQDAIFNYCIKQFDNSTQNKYESDIKQTVDFFTPYYEKYRDTLVRIDQIQYNNNNNHALQQPIADNNNNENNSSMNLVDDTPMESDVDDVWEN